MSVSPETESQATGWRLMGRALRARNYRLFFSGQGISLIGTWMQRVAMSWLVYRLTGSPLLLGSVDFSGQITACLVSPFAGVVADQHSRHRVIVITQVLSMVQAALLAVLVLTDTVQVWHLFALAIFLGLINSFDMPARQAFVVEMIEDRADLSNAIALNSTLFNAARLLGPSLAGLVIAATGEGFCFLVNALSYLAVIGSLLAMTVRPRPTISERPAVWPRLREGFDYVWSVKPIRSVLLLVALVNLVGMPYMSLMPVFAKKVLHGGPHTMGFLMSAAGIGALCGAVYLASRRQARGLPTIMATATVLFGLGLLGFSQSEHLPTSMAAMLLTGAGMVSLMICANTLLQTLVDDDKRGRVMAIYMMAFMGTAPIGSLVGGAAATKFGAPYTVLIGALLCLAGAAFFFLRLRTLNRQIRVMQEELGWDQASSCPN